MARSGIGRLSKQKRSGRKRERSTEEEVSGDEKEQIQESPQAVEDRTKRVRWGSEINDEGTEQDESQEEDSSISGKTCLAASCQSGRLGCAYYDPTKSLIYVLEDTQDNGHFDLTHMLLEQVDPDIILTSSKADDSFMDVLRNYMAGSGGLFQVRPHKDFVPAKGRDRLLSLHILSELSSDAARSSVSDTDTVSEARNAYDFMKQRRDLNGDPVLKRWNASIRLCNFASLESSPFCLASVGALIDHLARERAFGALEDDGIGGLDVRGIEPLTLDQVMQINADALFSLQIFENESHASIHSDKTKEGLSLFGILNNTKTVLGRSLFRVWLLRPSLSIPTITARHDAVACFLRPENLVTADAMHNILRGIKNVPRILSTMRAGKAGTPEWQGLVKFTFYSAMLRDALIELYDGGTVVVVRKLIAALDISSFKDVGSLVNETIDWEESTNAGRVCVRPHIDEELDNLKHIYHGIDSVLSKVAEQICTTVPSDYASSLNVVYFPQLGFLVCIPMLEEWKNNEEITEIEGWSFQFSSDSHVYFKSKEMNDMDLHIGDLHPAIVDREIEIIQALLEKILVHDDAMANACDICAELDCLLSFAEASRAYDYHRPHMSEENVIEIKQGRHPLQEQVVDTFVPNDIFLAGGSGCASSRGDTYSEASGEEDGRANNSVLVCTGANACGKSVFLKQTALIQYMAQIGCFVPAQSATLGITDKIFTRIQTRESVSRVQSAFMIDLNQVSLALRNCTERSLLLLDEFGKGTVSTDGAGLVCAVLKHLVGRDSSCPKVLATTHFHELFSEHLLDPHLLPITFVHMQVMITSSTGEVLGDDGTPDSTMEEEEEEEGHRRVGPGEKITYLYRVANGLALESHATKCAEIFGIPRRIVQRAQYVTHLLSTHSIGKLLDEEMSESERKDLEDAEAVCRKFLAWDFGTAGENGEKEVYDVKEKLAEVLGRTLTMEEE